MFKVLSTKKLESSLVEEANKKNIEIIEKEAIAIQPRLNKETWDQVYNIIRSGIEHVVFTSPNAVYTLRRLVNDYTNPYRVNWKIFALSGKTSQAIEEVLPGLGTIIEHADNATELVKKIRSHKIQELVFFCSDIRRDVLPENLKADGVKVHEVILYNTEETPFHFTEQVDAVLFFSPSGVRSFFSTNQVEPQTICFVIGRTTADAVSEFTGNRIIETVKPSQEEMIGAVINYFKNRQI